VLLVAVELSLRGRYRRLVLPAAQPARGQITIVALGDSIVAGTPGSRQMAWPTLLADRLRQVYPRVSWQVVNAGVPGDTAPLGYVRFERDVAAVGPQLVFIAFGLNDCNPVRSGMDLWLEAEVPAGPERSYVWQALWVRMIRLGRRLGWLLLPSPKTTGLLHPRTSRQGFAKTLDALVAKGRLIGARSVLLTMTPLADPLDEAGRARADIYLVYNRIIRERAAALGVPLIQLAMSLGVSVAESADAGIGPPQGAFESDGIHLTAVGQAWVAGQVFRQGEATGIWTRLVQEARP
jgi:lysophospholipase L1-like esterase